MTDPAQPTYVNWKRPVTYTNGNFVEHKGATEKIQYNSIEGGLEALKDLIALPIDDNSAVAEYFSKYGIVEGYNFEPGSEFGKYLIDHRVYRLLEIKTLVKMLKAFYDDDYETLLQGCIILALSPLNIENLLSSEDPDLDFSYNAIVNIWSNEQHEEFHDDFYTKVKIDLLNEVPIMDSEQELRFKQFALANKDKISHISGMKLKYALDFGLMDIHPSVTIQDAKVKPLFQTDDLSSLLHYEVFLTISDRKVWKRCAYRKCRKPFQVSIDDKRPHKYCPNYGISANGKEYKTSCFERAKMDRYREDKKGGIK